jgi:DNA-directed RNA polymerase subunit RPC12/RpoP
MAVTAIHEDKVVKCSNCKIGLNYTTDDEKLNRNKTYMFIKCPRCEHEVLTTKLNNFGFD